MGKNGGHWGKWNKAQDGAWNSWSDGAWSSDGGSQRTDDKPKNWRCPVCAFTGNCAWWSKCGRESCGAAWTPKPDDTPAPTSAAEPTKAQELAMTREELCCLVKLLPAGHATVTEYAAKVKVLEEEQKNSVSTAERLRRLLHAQKSMEGKQAAARTAKEKALETLAKASKALQERVEECQTITEEIAANALEVAEVTRSAAPDTTATASPTISMVQDLRGQIDILQPADLQEVGMDLAGLGTFFGTFGKVLALLEAAKLRAAAAVDTLPTVAPPPPTPAPTPAPAVISSQIPAGQADPLPPPPAPVASTVADLTIDATTDGAMEAIEKADLLLKEVRKMDVEVPDELGSSG